ncbi:MAG TPA: sialate O-acetylesterase [Candidatus Sumerlaeota bacterium]|nr:sialate O-acetylesterase [Candidatus Sumerlaeota bacterium]
MRQFLGVMILLFLGTSALAQQAVNPAGVGQLQVVKPTPTPTPAVQPGAANRVLISKPVAATPQQPANAAGAPMYRISKPAGAPVAQPVGNAVAPAQRVRISKPAGDAPQQDANAVSAAGDVAVREPVVVRPAAAQAVQPAGQVGVQPAEPVVVQPAAPVAAKPVAPVVVQPAAPVVVQPAAPVVVQPGASQGVQAPGGVVQPGAEAAAQPAADPNAPQRELISAVPADGSEAPVAGVDVYVLAGQSNMQGTAKVKGLPAAFNRPMPNVFFWTGAAFEQLLPGKTKTSAREDEFGPELTFAATMASYHPGRLIYLIKYNAGDAALHEGWNGDNWEGGAAKPGRQNFYPGEGPDDPNAGMQYLNLRNLVRTALENLKKTTLPFQVRAIVWMQGEHDSKQQESALAYSANLARLKRRIEEDLGCGPVPLVYGQVLPYEPALTRFVARREIRASQQVAHCLSGQPAAIRGAWMVPTDGMPLLPDTVHYAPLGQAMLGEAFALGVLQAEEALKVKAAQEALSPAGQVPAAGGQTTQTLTGQPSAGTGATVQQPVVAPVQPVVAPAAGGQQPDDSAPEENTLPV